MHRYSISLEPRSAEVRRSTPAIDFDARKTRATESSRSGWVRRLHQVATGQPGVCPETSTLGIRIFLLFLVHKRGFNICQRNYATSMPPDPGPGMRHNPTLAVLPEKRSFGGTLRGTQGVTLDRSVISVQRTSPRLPLPWLCLLRPSPRPAALPFYRRAATAATTSARPALAAMRPTPAVTTGL